MKAIFLKYSTVIAIFLSASTMIISLFSSDTYFLYRYSYLLYVLIGILYILFIILIFKRIRKNKKSVTIALLGFPCTGKSVYLTVLFNELQKIQNNNINFLPYGNETIDKVSSDISKLQLGEWLPATAIDQFFYYRAITTIGGMIKNTYKLEIGDFAGKQTRGLSNCTWLHKDKYFDYTLQSDAIFLAVSAEIFFDHIPKVETVNSIIAAINLLSQKKGYSDTQKMKEPICLLILKSDLLIDLELGNKGEDNYLDEISDILTVCKKRSIHFRTFFVSSVGKVSNNQVPEHLKPRNVVEPLLWILPHAN